MSAASSNRDARRSAGDVIYVKGHSGYHVYAGTLVHGTSAGYVLPAVGTSAVANRFIGVAWDEIDCSSTNSKITVADGAETGRVYRRGVFTFAANGTPAQSHVGMEAYIADDQTVGVSYGPGNICGRIVDYTSSTYRVQIDPEVGERAGLSGWWLRSRMGYNVSI